MEPRIQYVKANDGASIAYWKLGEGGTPLLMTPPLGVSNISLEWQMPELRAWYERLSSQRLLVRYDPRGMGMSERDVLDFSFEANVGDLGCVADQVGERPFDLLASAVAGMWAIKFAVQEPASIRRLVLLSALAEPYGPRTSERLDALLSLAEKDWDLAVETFSHATLGWSRGHEAREWAAVIKASIRQEDFVRGWQEWRKGGDVLPLLPQVVAPTLVLDSQSSLAVPHRNARLLASGIPNAQLLQLGPEAPFENEQGTVAIEEFLSDGQPSQAAIPVAPRVELPSGTAIILFTDIVDSTALTERLGDTAFRGKARALDGLMRVAIRENGGTAVEGKTLGDGVLAVFMSAREAIACAQACHDAATATSLSLHAGIHAGDVIREADNVYGGAVNIAARVAAASAAGETLVSGTVREFARTSAGVAFEDRGEQTLKGIGEPVRVFAVNWSER